MSLYKKSKRNFFILIGAVFAGTLFLDQLLKHITQTYIGENNTVPFLGDFLYFNYVKNYGASFGILAEWEYKNILFFVLTLVGLPAFVYILYIRRSHSLWGVLGMVLMISGTVGNAIDRAIYSTVFFDGYVRDFICAPWFATFNIADSCMVVGAIMVILAMLFFDEDAVFPFRRKKADSISADSSDEQADTNDDPVEFTASASQDESSEAKQAHKCDILHLDESDFVQNEAASDNKQFPDDELPEFNDLTFEMLDDLDSDTVDAGSKFDIKVQ